MEKSLLDVLCQLDCNDRYQFVGVYVYGKWGFLYRNIDVRNVLNFDVYLVFIGLVW